MTISAFDASGKLLDMETYYSIGGGFIATADELQNGKQESETQVEFPFSSADQLLELADKNGMSLGGLILRNEVSFQDMEAIDQKSRSNLEGDVTVYAAWF